MSRAMESWMTIGEAGTERLAAFSDGVIAIIITIMVLDLRPPHTASPAALLALWPTFAGYAISYLFVAIVWVNHHHIIRYTAHADAPVVWSNFVFLFFVSLIPFCTAFLAETRMSSFSTALYAADFLLIAISFSIFQRAVTRQHKEGAEWRTMVRGAARRNWIAAITYAVAIPAAYVHPAVSLVLILAVAGLYFAPRAQKHGMQ